MESYPIKSVTFGGFDKQDVIAYIENQAKAAAGEQAALREEGDRLRAELTKAREELEGLKSRLAEEQTAREQAQEALRRETELREELEGLRGLPEELERARAEAEALRPDAETYARFRERLGAIECDARKRADDLERASQEKMRRAVSLFREQYQALMQVFEATAGHVTGELRKVEVNLTQLPRAMDQAGAELSALSEQLDRAMREQDTDRK